MKLEINLNHIFTDKKTLKVPTIPTRNSLLVDNVKFLDNLKFMIEIFRQIINVMIE